MSDLFKANYVNYKGEAILNGWGGPIAGVSPASHDKPVRAPSSTPKKVKNRDEASYSFGFLVTGYSPESIHKAQERCRKLGEVWDEAGWLKKTRPKRIRSKAYETQAGADACAELARKAGWLCVEIKEALKA